MFIIPYLILLWEKKYMSRFIVKKIVILHGKEKVASHQQRSYCGGDWCIKLEHYLRTLSVNRGGIAPLCGLAKSTGRTEKAV